MWARSIGVIASACLAIATPVARTSAGPGSSSARGTQRSTERAILAATVSVRSLDRATRALDRGGIAYRSSGRDRHSVWVAPEAAYGLWLERREAFARPR